MKSGPLPLKVGSRVYSQNMADKICTPVRPRYCGTDFAAAVAVFDKCCHGSRPLDDICSHNDVMHLDVDSVFRVNSS